MNSCGISSWEIIIGRGAEGTDHQPMRWWRISWPEVRLCWDRADLCNDMVVRGLIRPCNTIYHQLVLPSSGKCCIHQGWVHGLPLHVLVLTIRCQTCCLPLSWITLRLHGHWRELGFGNHILVLVPSTIVVHWPMMSRILGSCVTCFHTSCEIVVDRQTGLPFVHCGLLLGGIVQRSMVYLVLLREQHAIHP